MGKTAIILGLCVLTTIYLFTNAQPVEESNCLNSLKIEEVKGSGGLTELAATLTIPEVLRNNDDSWRLELATDVPYQFISGTELWIKHFSKEGRVIIRGDINQNQMTTVELNMIWSESSKPRKMRFSWNDGPVCTYTLTAPETATTPVSRRRRTTGDENSSGKRPTNYDRRWDVNQGRSYFLTRIDDF